MLNSGGQFPAPRLFDNLKVFDPLRLEKSPELAEGQGIIMFFLYILRGPRNHLYVGTTISLEKRILRHKSGDGAEFAKRNITFELVYNEKYSTLLEARRREKQIKGWRREKKENLIKVGKPVI